MGIPDGSSMIDGRLPLAERDQLSRCRLDIPRAEVSSREGFGMRRAWPGGCFVVAGGGFRQLCRMPTRRLLSWRSAAFVAEPPGELLVVAGAGLRVMRRGRRRPRPARRR
jgi:hypothetical protein